MEKGEKQNTGKKRRETKRGGKTSKRKREKDGCWKMASGRDGKGDYESRGEEAKKKGERNGKVGLRGKSYK